MTSSYQNQAINIVGLTIYSLIDSLSKLTFSVHIFRCRGSTESARIPCLLVIAPNTFALKKRKLQPHTSNAVSCAGTFALKETFFTGPHTDLGVAC